MRVEILNGQGVSVQSFPNLPISGSQVFPVPANLGRSVFFRLVASRGGQEAVQDRPVRVNCSASWFFGDQFASGVCPAGVGALAAGQVQRFERGVMIYVTANGLNRVYVLSVGDSRYTSYLNGWDGTTIVNGTPPSGLFDAQGIFNWVYNSTVPSGFTNWNAAIGWGTTARADRQVTIQYEELTGAFYINAPTDTDAVGSVYRMAGGDSNVWTQVR